MNSLRVPATSRSEYFDCVTGGETRRGKQLMNEVGFLAHPVGSGQDLAAVEQHVGTAQANADPLDPLAQARDEGRAFLHALECHGLTALADVVAHVLGIPLVRHFAGVAIDDKLMPRFGDRLRFSRHTRGTAIQ